MNGKNYIPHFKRTLLLLLLMPPMPLLIAQDRLPEPIRFLTQDFHEIDEIEQDNNGRLWLATDKGLHCFDGSFYRRIVHSPGGISTVDNARINDLFLDREAEKLWISGADGVSALDLQTEIFSDFTFYQKDNPQLTDGECHSIFKDRTGALWFGVSKLGLARLDPDTDSVPRIFPLPREVREGIRDFYIYQIAQDATEDSTFWLATLNTGLVRFDAKTSTYNIPDAGNIAKEVAEPSGNITFTSLYPTENKIFLGNIWRPFCVVYDLRTHAFHSLDFPEPFRLGATEYRSPGTFWNYYGLVHIIDIEKEQIIRSFFQPYEEEGVTDGFLAAPNRLWIGSNKGLLLYNFSDYQVENHILLDYETHKPSILAGVLEKEDGTGFWLVFQNSDFLYEYDRQSGVRRALPWPKGRPGAPVRLPDGRILFVGARGFYELRDDRLVALPLFEELIATGLSLPVQDNDGYLWAGSRYGSLYKMDLEKEQYWDYGQRIGLQNVPHIFKDADDNIWMGGDGFLVYHAHKDTFFTFPFRPGEEKTIHYPRGFAQDAEGNVWISDIRVGGLLKIDPSRLPEGIQERYVAHNGPLSNKMYSPTIDRRGRIWTITLDGLQAFDPQTETFTLYGASSGLRLRTKDDKYDNLIPAYLTLLSTGEMLVGYKEGFAIFHPDSLLGNQERPQPYLLAVQAGERTLFRGAFFTVPAVFSLEHDQNRLSFEFSAVAWREPEKVRYQYRLKGLDDQWTETTHHQVNYTHLPPGSYAFLLYALNSDGKKREAPLEVQFEILLPWWRTLWAYGFYLTAILAAACSLYRYKKRQWRLRAQLAMEHREAERLKELDEFKTRLYTNITHEFRTPLTVILGMTEQIKRNPQDWYNKGLQMIRRNGDNLLRLVNQMLDLAKLEAGTLPIHWVQGDVISYLKYLLESFHSRARAKNIDLSFSTDLPSLNMDYDPEKLRQIFSNLMSNALKFTPKGGGIAVRAGRFSRTPTKEGSERNTNIGDFLELRVKDNGIGIPQEKLPFVFDRFYQVEDEITLASGAPSPRLSARDYDARSGTGIGLALTRELVKLLGGSITVVSLAGKGSEFCAYLPIHRTAGPAGTAGFPFSEEALLPFVAGVSEEGEEMEGNGGDKPLLLIIEDNRDVVRYLYACLQTDYRLEAAYDGKDGVEKARKLIPEIIISDVMMPGADGFEVCRTLKQDMLTSHIPIILLTAKADMPSRIEGLGAGADAYLSKPFHRRELLVLIEKMIELRRRLQERYSQTGARPPLVDPEQAQHYAKEDIFLENLHQILSANLSDPEFGIGPICRAIGVSRVQLHRKLKALTGKSTSHYIREFRLHRAVELLHTSDLNITEICFEVGFTSPSYFSRLFTETFGKSPSEMRRKAD